MKKLRQILIVLPIALGLVSGQNCPAADPVPLKIGVTPIFPPVIYKEGGKITGVEADFAKALGEALGRPVQFVEVSWEDQLPALTDGRTDIIMSSMSITHTRELRIAFSKPYSNSY